MLPKVGGSAGELEEPPDSEDSWAEVGLLRQVPDTLQAFKSNQQRKGRTAGEELQSFPSGGSTVGSAPRAGGKAEEERPELKGAWLGLEENPNGGVPDNPNTGHQTHMRKTPSKEAQFSLMLGV